MVGKYKLRHRKVNIAGYNTGIIKKLKQRAFKGRVAFILVLFLFFQLLSPFGSFLATNFANASSLAISTYSPAKDGHMTTIGDNIVLTFNQAIEWPYYSLEPSPGRPTIDISRISPSYGSVASFAGSRPQGGTGPAGVTISGNTLTLNIPVDLVLGSQYSVEIGPGTICEYGNYDLIDGSTCFSGIYGASTYYFTVGSSSVAPTVTAPTSSNITSSSAVLGADVISTGGAAVTSRGVAWSTTNNPTTADTKATATGETGVFTVNATGLTAGTRYYYRAYATNSVGTTYGANMFFDTLGAPPSVSITTFDLPTTSDSLTVPITTLVTTGSVSHYYITESTNGIAYDAAGWVATRPTSYTFTSAGAKTLRVWVKTGTGQSEVFGPVTDTVTITLPPVTVVSPTYSPTSGTASLTTATVINITGPTGSTIYATCAKDAQPSDPGVGLVGAYSPPVTLGECLAGASSGTVNFKAVAVKDGIDSSVVLASYVVAVTNTAPVITTNPASKTATTPATATFTCAANGTPTPTYKWQSAPAGGTFADITPAATSTTYTTPVTTTADTGKQYRCAAMNSVSTVYSSAATLTVTALPELTTSNKSTPISKLGGNVVISFANTSDSKISSGFSLVDITEATTSTHTAPSGKSFIKVYTIDTDQSTKTGYNVLITLAYPSGQTYKTNDTVMYWDTASSSWKGGIENGIIVVSGTGNTITFNTTHFTEFAILTEDTTTPTPVAPATPPPVTGGTLPTTGSATLNMFLNFLLALGGYLLLTRGLKKSRFAAFVG